MQLPLKILEHYEDPFHRGECESPTHVAECENAQTHCVLRVELRLTGTNSQKIEDAWWDGDGCPVCEGIASLLAERLISQDLQELKTLSFQGFVGSELDLAESLEGVEWPACAQLPFTVLWAALDECEGLVRQDGLAAEERSSDFDDFFSGPSLREEC